MRKPIKRDYPKIGRNEPCPCGSGVKHKKCCLLKRWDREKSKRDFEVSDPASNIRKIIMLTPPLNIKGIR